MTELRQCPFCGQTRYLCTLAEGERDERQYAIVCDASGDGGCGASCGWQDTIAEAKEAWNRRAVTTRRKGKWEKRPELNYIDPMGVEHIHGRCSECGFIHDFIDAHTAQYDYCPQCGAKLAGGGDAE